MLATEVEALMMSEQEREAERKRRYEIWVTQLESASNHVLSRAFSVGLGGIALGAVLDWLFDWKFLYYAAGIFGIVCYLDSMMKSLEVQRRRFHLSMLAPLEDTIDRIERRLANIEKIRGTDERA
jgi:hypothetical protein